VISLNTTQSKILKIIINKYPELIDLANTFNKEKINWAIAAGSAYSIYSNQTDIDDVDIWISAENKNQIGKILNKPWVKNKSDRHEALNITHKSLDLFTNCIKTKNGNQVLDYVWTHSVSTHLRTIQIDNVNYKVLSPEDIVLLKVANPRSDKEIKQISTLIRKPFFQNKYFQLRLKECATASEVYEQLKNIK